MAEFDSQTVSMPAVISLNFIEFHERVNMVKKKTKGNCDIFTKYKDVYESLERLSGNDTIKLKK